MVDIDRLRDKFSGKKEDEDKKKKGSSKSRNKRKKKKTNSGDDKEETKREKLDKIKGVSSKRGKTKGSSDDIKKLLFCVGNMNIYPRVVKKKQFDGVKKADKQIKKEVCDDFASEAMNFIGVFNAEKVADKYGYSLNQIMQIIRDNQDMSGQSMNTNMGDVKKKDVKELLDCIANIFLYVEGSMRAMEEEENKKRKQTVKMHISRAVYKYYKHIISKTEVQKIAEKHGYDWKEDIVNKVLTNQSIESKINEHY